MVRVAMRNGEPDYEIVCDVAWDFLEFDASWQELARTCDGVCFGTLAQRSPAARQTIQQFVAAATQAVRLFDVNLRQNYFDQSLLERSLQLSSAVKLNADELEVLRDLLQLSSTDPADRCREMLERFELSFVAWTRGALGTTVIDGDGIHTAPAVTIDTSQGTPVGAGDATAAALLHGYLARWPWQRTLRLANTLGAYVATQPGACPKLPQEILDLL
jgi:fructokinase